MNDKLPKNMVPISLSLFLGGSSLVSEMRLLLLLTMLLVQLWIILLVPPLLEFVLDDSGHSGETSPEGTESVSGDIMAASWMVVSSEGELVSKVVTPATASEVSVCGLSLCTAVSIVVVELNENVLGGRNQNYSRNFVKYQSWRKLKGL